MKHIQKITLFLGTLTFLAFNTGCDLLYDCDAAETEITTMVTNLASAPWVENATLTKCNAYKDKVNEWVDEGCGDAEDADLDCVDFTCTAMSAQFLLYGLSMAFSFDEATYCAYYDSTGMAAQEMVNAGGCAAYFDDGAAITQSAVDAWVTSGCDWGDSTGTARILDPFKGLNSKETKIVIEELANDLPENYSFVIRKKLDSLFPN